MTDKFTLEFGLSDFDAINTTSMKSFYHQQSARFETTSDDPLPASDDGYMMYWVGEDALAALVSEKILIAAGYEVHRLWDMNENPTPEWCILTNYIDSMWQKTWDID